MAKDFLQRDIQVGDHVVFMETNYRNLVKGVIKSLTPKKAIISHLKYNNTITETIQFHNQLIKYDVTS